MQATEAFEPPADVPGHVRPFLTKQLKCQSLHRSTRHPQECPAGLSHFLMRHRSAADMRRRRSKRMSGTGWSPILQQFPYPPCPPIKAAAAPAGVRREVPGSSVTARNLPHGSSVSHLPIASQEAKQEMPTKYTFPVFF